MIAPVAISRAPWRASIWIGFDTFCLLEIGCTYHTPLHIPIILYTLHVTLYISTNSYSGTWRQYEHNFCIVFNLKIELGLKVIT